MFKQQLIGVINLAIPIVILAQIYPAFLLTFLGQFICSLFVGIYCYYLNYIASNNSIKNLQYSPSGEYKKELDDAIIKCKMNPNDITIRYSYTNTMVATTTFNTISLDPILCSETNQDEQALIAKDVIEKHVLINSSQSVKDNLIKINAILSPEAQRFVFKHELGHVFYNYAYKKLMLIGLIGFIMAYAGILTAIKTFSSLGFFAILLGIIVAGFVDLLLTYSSNVFFKAYEEKRADFFATKYSSKEEINSAADFFEKLQDIHDEADFGLYSKIPTIILSGHYNGRTRAKYLRAYSSN